MAILLPEGRQSFRNNAGLPLVGGKLYTYAAGTSTPKATYADADATTANTNPVILNARGEATIFWSGAYKVILKDASDNVIWTVDGVSGADVDITQLTDDLADDSSATKGAGQVGYSRSLSYALGSVGHKLNLIPTLYDFGGQPSLSYDNSPALTAALAAVDHVIVPPGDWGLGAMVEIGTQKCVELMAGATMRRMSALTADTSPVFWLKGVASVLKGAGRIASSIETQNRCPQGIVRIGHANAVTAHDNVLYCTLADLQIAGSTDYGQTTGSGDVCVYMPNAETDGLASYFHTVRDLRVSSANIGIWLHNHANANQISRIIGQELGNASIRGSMIELNGGADNMISDCFFHKSPGTPFIRITDEGATISAMNSMTGMVCEQEGGGLFLQANAGCSAVSNYIQGLDNTIGGIDISAAFAGANTIITRELFYTQTLYLGGPSMVGTWTSVPYVSGDYSGNGSMTWTVDSGDVLKYAYTIIGKTMTLSFAISGSSVGGTPNTNLLLKIPAGKTPKEGNIRGAVTFSDNGTAGAGSVVTVASDTQLAIQKVSGNWTASTNNTAVYGQITFEIN